MRLLFLTAPGQIGGLETVVQMLSTGLLWRGHDVLVVGVTDSVDAATDFFEGLAGVGVPIRRLAISGRDYRREYKMIRESIIAFRPDAVHTHGYRCDVLGGAAALKEGIRVVSTAHGFSGEGLRNRFYQWLQGRAYRRFDAVAAVSVPIFDRLARIGVPQSRLHLARNAYLASGVKVARDAARNQLGIGSPDFAVAWIGRLDREKGPDILLDAAAFTQAGEISFSLIGDGPLESHLRELASRRRIENVRFHGRVRNAAGLLSAFDAVALTSRTEGTPIVLLEAMAARIPIVATRVGGVPDMLNAKEALLVPSEDARAVYNAFLRLRSDHSLRASLAAAAHERLLRDFDFERWIAGYLSLYNGVNGALPAA